MKTLSAQECIIIIGYDDEEGDAHFYTVVTSLREMCNSADGTVKGLVENVIKEAGIKNVFLRRWIYENAVIDC